MEKEMLKRSCYYKVGEGNVEEKLLLQGWRRKEMLKRSCYRKVGEGRKC
jgi:hypothetical protein